MPFGGDFSQVLNIVNGIRMVSIHGFVGSGKTALAFALAQQLIEHRGYRYIVSNIDSVWTDDKDQITRRDGQYLDTVIILDEGGLFIDHHKKAKQWLAFMRKMNICILIPSVLPLPGILMALEIRRIANDSNLGIPRLTYQVALDIGNKSGGDSLLTFDWLQPAEIYGIYNTDAFPSTDDGILDWLGEHIAAAAAAHGYEETAKNRTITTTSISFGSSDDKLHEQVSTMGRQWGETFTEAQRQAFQDRSVSLLQRIKTS